MLARRGMVCSSVPIASAAGVEMLRLGGNAIDAAIAAAAVLCVVEPMMTGVGGDAFVLLGSAAEGRVVGLNGSGRAPAGATLDAYRARGLGAIAPRRHPLRHGPGRRPRLGDAVAPLRRTAPRRPRSSPRSAPPTAASR